MYFTTYDSDNGGCAVKWNSGWWYNGCYRININRQPPHYDYPKVTLLTEMKIRPKDCITQ